MQENLVLLSFDESAKAYQALAELKQAAAAGRVTVRAAAVVQRTADGVLQVRDGAADGAAADAPLLGTMLGSLLGVLAGPLGVLMLGATGAWLGSLASVDTTMRRLSLMEQITHAVPAGATVLFAQVGETKEDAMDTLAAGLGASVLRRPTEAVMAEVMAAAEAQDAAAAEARKVLHAQQRAEWKDKFEHWSQEVGSKFTALRDRIKARM